MAEAQVLYKVIAKAYNRPRSWLRTNPNVTADIVDVVDVVDVVEGGRGGCLLWLEDSVP
jgi:hypothetical protein